MKFIRSSLTVQLIIISSLFILICAVSMGILSYTAANNAFIDKLKLSDLNHVVDLKVGRIDQRIKRAKETSLLLSSDPIILEWFRGEEKDPVLGELVKNRLHELRVKYDYSHVDILNEKTRIDYQFVNREKFESYKVEESNLRDQWYFRLKRNKKKLEVKVERNPMYGRFFVFINALMGNPNYALGKAGVAIDFISATKEFTTLENYEGAGWLITKTGQIELSNKEAEIGKNIQEIFSKDIAQRILIAEPGENTFETANGKGKKMFYGKRKITETDWFLVYEVSYDPTAEPLLTIRLAMIGGITLSVLLVLLIYYFVTSRITKPIQELISITRQVADGNFSLQYKTAMKNEIGLLGKVFNSMTDSLKLGMETIQVVASENVENMTKVEVARRIQESLIPEKPEMKGYKIAGFMKTTEEVGGDYYDIVHTKHASYAVIGDVSGHGITAGLFMMMVQTALHTIIHENINKSPSIILTHINRTLKQNIDLLGEFRFMTILLLKFEKRKVIFAGAHEKILIYRKKTDTVEQIETSGFWLGIEMNIQAFLSDSKFSIYPGDMILLYTDGVTEANHKKNQEEMYGENRLIQILQTHGKTNPDQLKKEIIQSLKPYSPKDDVTFLVIQKE